MDDFDGILDRARAAIDHGHNALALDVLDTADSRLQNNDKLRYLRALALSRSGCAKRALSFLKESLRNPDLPMLDRMDALSLAGKL